MGHGASREDVNALADFDDEAFPPLASVPEDPFTSPDSLTDRVRRMVTDNLGSDTLLAGSPDDSKQEDTVPAVFSWSKGGDQVYITGSFNDWSGKIPMHRSSNDFTLILDVPPGKHQYKFIVDDEWRYAPDQPTVYDDNGLAVNQIEVSRNQTYDGTFVAADENDVYNYGSLIPSAQDYTKDPPMIPPHLGFIVLNSPIDQTDADPILPVPQHVTLNHLYSSISAHDRFFVLASTQRFKTKFVTTVYYKPANSSTPDPFSLSSATSQ